MTPYWTDGQATFYQGDVRDCLRELPAESVQTCVTSPPYWGLRDYGVPGQLGLEATPEAFVSAMVEVFREVKRVLRDDGTLWLNIGDSYFGTGKGPTPPTEIHGANGTPYPTVGVYSHDILKGKDLVGIPWMLAFALRADGWYLRQDIIWAKPNPMPESVTDRCTKSHEYLFLLSKSARYYYDADAIREAPMRPEWASETRTTPGNPDRNDGGGITARPRATDKQRGHSRRHAGFNDRWDAMTKEEQGAGGRNKRSVWTIATQPYPEAHFATYPEELVRPCVLAGSREGDTVLDPFLGSGTTAWVAKSLGRKAVGIDLSADYLGLAVKRNQQMAMPSVTCR